MIPRKWGGGPAAATLGRACRGHAPSSKRQELLRQELLRQETCGQELLRQELLRQELLRQELCGKNSPTAQTPCDSREIVEYHNSQLTQNFLILFLPFRPANWRRNN